MEDYKVGPGKPVLNGVTTNLPWTPGFLEVGLDPKKHTNQTPETPQFRYGSWKTRVITNYNHEKNCRESMGFTGDIFLSRA